MNKLPIFKSDDEQFMLHQTKWSSVLNPVLSIPLNDGQILPSVSLVAGTNVINHRLGRKLTGWIITRLRAAATVSDTQDSNPNPQQTLYLTSSINVVVDLFVF